MKFKTEKEKLFWAGRLIECLDDLLHASYETDDKAYLKDIIEAIEDGYFDFEGIYADPDELSIMFELTTGACFCVGKLIGNGVIFTSLHKLVYPNELEKELYLSDSCVVSCKTDSG